MLFIFFALMAGFAIGKILPRGDSAYGLCVAVGVALYSALKMILTGELDMTWYITGGILQSPVLMLGAWLARRHTRRASFESE